MRKGVVTAGAPHNSLYSLASSLRAVLRIILRRLAKNGHMQAYRDNWRMC
jgi:hypothetical protein